MRKEITPKGEIKFICEINRVDDGEHMRSDMTCTVQIEEVVTDEIMAFLRAVIEQLVAQAPDDEAKAKLAVTLLSSGMPIVKDLFENSPRLAQFAIERPELLAGLKQAARSILPMGDEVEVQPSTQEMIERALRGGGAQA